ncbi:MAG: bifunctional diaminohydroxyphosphoribosylaminopyrimidine deaminase/5-amino-6-(5-phosphoribosylamino)uracil reductase RibD [Deltaproteobacteria bacterium]|nr:bifunctional diaminohydroxyphosphoribosylaminopyrimidine deaminase/5-amino-6-(5-phosphoribosylamino)uracil reductase RibD [Deltaproteobacteria bacterium]
MDRAIEAARKGLGSTAPNPAVGAVIVRGDDLLAEGTTRPVGGLHAEVVALEAARLAGVEVGGATMYITLEPCCHHGRTPPCTDALVDSGIRRVVVGVVDPFPLMRGNGLRQLREAGIEVVLGVRAERCAEVVRGFARAVTAGLPEVSCKVASTLDGHIAAHDGQSQWITGEGARQHGHLLRAQHDAILVGIGTVLADDPRLTCRVREGADPVPVVLDSALRIPADAALFDHPRRPVVLCAQDAPDRDLSADVVRIARGSRGIDIEAGLRALVQHGLHRVLVEGGGRVHRSLFDARLVDTLYLYLGGLVLPGGIPWLGGEPAQDLASAPRLGTPVVERVGDDLLLRYPVRHRLDEEG